MANSKKVQQEIDRLVRRVQESNESFDGLYDKYLKADTQLLKERVEGDLKKDIKRAQRLRENIKTFIASPEVKDTKVLESSLKSIEERMELFKSCERETKTKAFSREGLAASSPYETLQAQREASLKSTMEDLRKQIDIIEYDLERDKRGQDDGRTKSNSDAAAARLRRLRFHLGKLELVLKAVANKSADLYRVSDAEEYVQRLLQNEINSDDEDEEGLYSGFALDDGYNSDKRRGGTGQDDELGVFSGVGQAVVKKSPASTSPTAASVSTITCPSVKKTATPPLALSKTETVKKPPTTQSGVKAQSPGGCTTSASYTSLGKPISSREIPMDTWDENEELLDDDMDRANADTFGDDVMELTTPGTLADLAKATAALPRMGDWEKGRPASLISPPSTASKTQVNEQTIQQQQQQQQPGTAATTVATPSTTTTQTVKPASTTTTTTTTTSNTTSTGAAAVSPRATTLVPSPSQAATATAPLRVSEQKQQTSTNTSSTAIASATTSGSGTATVSSNQAATNYDKTTMLRLVDMSLANLPHTQDVDRQRSFEPSNPTTCPSYYPQEVLPALAFPDIYSGFELETLFFIFYYNQNTYQQYYAAKQIKARSFRYHKELNTWFQRKGTPKETQGDGERGSFRFFNYEDTWRMEEKEDFTFNYKFLEDELR